MHMKQRITLTIEPSVSHRGKAVARSRGTSLSGLVEELLNREAGRGSNKSSPVSFADRWKAKFQLNRKIEDSRHEALKERYGL